MEKPIWYEPHPVTPERKAEIVAKGYCIIDAAYMPHDYVPEWLDPKEQPKGPDFESMDEETLVDCLRAYGVRATTRMKRETLIAKLKEVADHGEV